jgi:Na+/glutamate symporter
MESRGIPLGIYSISNNNNTTTSNNNTNTTNNTNNTNTTKTNSTTNSSNVTEYDLCVDFTVLTMDLLFVIKQTLFP